MTMLNNKWDDQFPEKEKGNRKPKKENEKSNFNVKAAVASVVIIALAIAGAFLLFGGDNNTKTKAELTDEQKKNAQNFAEDFIVKDGTFGLSFDKVNAENISGVRNFALTDVSKASSYLTLRGTKYEEIRGDIYSGSPIDYNSGVVQNWDNTIESQYLSGLKVTETSSNADDPYLIFANRGDDSSNTIALDVNVNYNSLQRTVVETSNDADWNGTYDVKEAKYNETAKVTVVSSDGNNWKVYNVENENKPFLLTTWGTPLVGDYASMQNEYTTVDTWKTDPPLKQSDIKSFDEIKVPEVEKSDASLLDYSDYAKILKGEITEEEAIAQKKAQLKKEGKNNG